jgi:hypothetical protein
MATGKLGAALSEVLVSIRRAATARHREAATSIRYA